MKANVKCDSYYYKLSQQTWTCLNVYSYAYKKSIPNNCIMPFVLVDFLPVIDFIEKDIYQLSKEFTPSTLLGKLQDSVCGSIFNRVV